MDYPSLKSLHQCRIEEFMLKIPQAVPPKPVMPSPDIRLLRAKLILEEAIETIHGLGFDVTLIGGHRIVEMENVLITDAGHIPPSLTEIADGCADLSVVTTGTLSACGIADMELLKLVDLNNLAKFGIGGYRREDGKWIKPPDHKPPDITGLLVRQMKVGTP